MSTTPLTDAIEDGQTEIALREAAKLMAEVMELRTRLEIDSTPYDGIATRDETIRLLEKEVAEARSELYSTGRQALARDLDECRQRLSEASSEIQRWRDVTNRKDPEDCAAGIAMLYARWQEAERERDAHKKSLDMLYGVPFSERCYYALKDRAERAEADYLRRHKDAADQYEARIAAEQYAIQLREALERTQWGGGSYCEVCARAPSWGHAADCSVGLALAKNPTEPGRPGLAEGSASQRLPAESCGQVRPLPGSTHDEPLTGLSQEGE